MLLFVLVSLALLVELVMSLEIDLRFIVPEDRPKITPKPPQDRPLEKYDFV